MRIASQVFFKMDLYVMILVKIVILKYSPPSDNKQPPSNNYNILQLSQYPAENKCNKTQIETNYTHSDIDGISQT